MKDKMMKDKTELKKYYSTKEFLENYIYEGNNLGVECKKERHSVCGHHRRNTLV